MKKTVKTISVKDLFLFPHEQAVNLRIFGRMLLIISFGLVGILLLFIHPLLTPPFLLIAALWSPAIRTYFTEKTRIDLSTSVKIVLTVLLVFAIAISSNGINNTNEIPSKGTVTAPTASPPTPEPTIVPTVQYEYCGDSICQPNEGCSSCPNDCGVCPTPEPTIDISRLVIPTNAPQYIPPVQQTPYTVDANVLTKDKIGLNQLAVSKAWCNPGITPTSDVRQLATQITPKTGSDSYPYVENAIAIYKWIKQNIQYQLGPIGEYPNTGEQTLRLQAGKCDEQANALASMIMATGGIARVSSIEACSHAYAEVFFPTTTSQELESIVGTINQEFGTTGDLNYHNPESFENIQGVWIPFDTAATLSPGKVLDSCKNQPGKVTYYCATGCDDKYPYLLVGTDKCYQQCPSGSITQSNTPSFCYSCPSDHPTSYNNDCYQKCSEIDPAHPWFYQTKCYSSCPWGTQSYDDGTCK